MFSGDFAWQWRAVLGSSLSDSEDIVHTLNRVVLHPQYDHSALNFDVAILHFNNPAVYSNNVQAGSIAGSNYQVADGATVTHIGWRRLWVIIYELIRQSLPPLRSISLYAITSKFTALIYEPRKYLVAMSPFRTNITKTYRHRVLLASILNAPPIIIILLFCLIIFNAMPI